LQTYTVKKTWEYIAQHEEQNCRPSNIDNVALNSSESTSSVAEGIDQLLSFDGKFSVERMDFQFNQPVVMPYNIKEHFIELLYTDSLEAVNREYGEGEFRYGRGIYIYMNQGNTGEVRFSHKVPVKGLKIVIREDFYRSYLKKRFPNEYLDIGYLFTLNNKNYPHPELGLIFEQVRRNMGYGVDSELYYESKMAEILFTVAGKNSARWQPFRKRLLSKEDFIAVTRVREIIETQLSDPPQISELAFLTGTSVTKLQQDFKAAFGHTIHGYLQKNRMASALRKIECTDDPLYVISQGVGFKKPSRLTEIFKRTYGMTPKEYRKTKIHRQLYDNARTD
jgi:AraC-like DNA-binding protein